MDPKRILRRFGKTVVQEVAVRLPAPSSRLDGPAAIAGGTPVRDTRLRPWPSYPPHGPLDWVKRFEPALRRVFLSGIEGLPQPEAQRFNEGWASYCGTQHSLLLPHGTDALRIGLGAALDSEGHSTRSEVIVPNLTFIASANAVLDRGYDVALVDVDPETLTLDARRVEEAVRPGRTRAIVAVHLFGQPADMAALRAVAERHDLMVVEDAAQAHGAQHLLGRAGSLGAFGAFSFQSSKNLCAGEGGALTTNDRALYERAWSLHNVGRSRESAQRWGHETFGLNVRPTEYLAAILNERLTTFEDEAERRFLNFKLLREFMTDVECLRPLAMPTYVLRHGVHMCVFRYIAEACGGLALPDFLRAVQAENVPLARAYEQTLSNQPAMRRMQARYPERVRVAETPAADTAVRNLVFLPHPLFLGGRVEMEELAAAFRKVERHHTRRQPISRQAIARDAPVEISRGPPQNAGISVRNDHLRVGIVGLGAMGRIHAEIARTARGIDLVGIADMDSDTLRAAASDYHCQGFPSVSALIGAVRPDLLVVATPHRAHANDVVAAAESGVHVLCEKPLALTMSDADRLVDAAKRSSARIFVNQQWRFDAAGRMIRDMLASGELGRPYHALMVETSLRSQAYYAGSPWRGTWAGEGGGVVVNQAPHVFDRYLWFFGRPRWLSARCDRVLHDIEVEDTASTTLVHESLLHGQLHVSTVDGPGVSRTVISCDRGRIMLEGSRLHVTRFRGSVREHVLDPHLADKPVGAETYEVSIGRAQSDALLRQVYVELPLAISSGSALLCSIEEGRDVVEIMNAVHLSAAFRREVTLPLARSEYDSWLNAQSHFAASNEHHI